MNRCDPHDWESNVSAARALLAPRCMSSWSFYWFVTMQNVSRAIWFLHYFAVIGFWYWCVCVRAYVCKGDYKRMFISSGRWTKADVTLCGNIFVPEKYLWKEICLLALHLELFFPPNMSACKQILHSWFKKKELIVVFSTEGSLIKAHIKSIVSPNCHPQMPVLENQLTSNYKTFGIVSNKKKNANPRLAT